MAWIDRLLLKQPNLIQKDGFDNNTYADGSKLGIKHTNINDKCNID